uniref:Protein kinase domain-containing protein n=1 Tax=Kalanchoe fedtschenkoi TaxID=63787 RepID=A0A7N0UHP6_KALFE
MESDHSWWARGRCIGRGSFATVHIATTAESTARVFAVKSVDVSNSDQLIALENEIRVLRLLDSSPYVVQYLGDDTTTSPAGTRRNLHLEYLPAGVAVSAGGEQELLVRSYTRCLVSALAHLHSRNIIHCDVKGRNVLLGQTPGQCKLADFGSAADLSHSHNAATVSPRGSPLWMAPEVLRGEYQGPESDVWSLGCTVIEMLTGKPAWRDRGADTLWRIAFSNETPELPACISEQGREFLSVCLRREAAERWSCQQLLNHPFVSSTEFHTLSPSTPRCVLDGFDSDFVEYEETDSNSNSTSTSTSELKVSDSSLTTEELWCGGRGPAWDGDGWMTVRRTEYSDRDEDERTEEDGGSGCGRGCWAGSGCGACLCGHNSHDVFGALLMCRLLSSITLTLLIISFFYVLLTTLYRPLTDNDLFSIGFLCRQSSGFVVNLPIIFPINQVLSEQRQSIFLRILAFSNLNSSF